MAMQLKQCLGVIAEINEFSFFDRNIVHVFLFNCNVKLFCLCAHKLECRS